MSTEINLLIRNKKGEQLAHLGSVKRIRIFALISLFIVAGLSTILFIIIATSPLQSLREKEAEEAAKLQLQQAKFGKELLVRDQLQAIAKLVEKRPNLASLIDIYLALIPPGILVDGIDVDAESASMSVTTSSLTALETFFAAIQTKVSESAIPPIVTSSGIKLDPQTGTYSLSLQFTQ